jgi:hypothetical protein
MCSGEGKEVHYSCITLLALVVAIAVTTAAIGATTTVATVEI